MNYPDTHHDHFDRAARDRHAQALEHLSPQVRSRLRDARRVASASAPSRTRGGWLLAGGTAAAALALMLGTQLQPTAPQANGTPRMANTGSVAEPATDPAERASQRVGTDSEIDDMLAALDENPDLYLWLAANDDTLPPPSEY